MKNRAKKIFECVGLARSKEKAGSDWYKQEVGGLWEAVGKLQFDFLCQQGLKPDHHFLDVGCGSLRGGVHFINYLQRGHYVGVDKSENLLKAGREIEVKRHDLESKEPVLTKMENFEFTSLHKKFDCALAQSVFTHLDLNRIIQCIVNIEKVLVSGGKFYATFFESPYGFTGAMNPVEHPCADQSHSLTSFFCQDPYHYSFDIFQFIGSKTDLDVHYLGNWAHPRDQRMMVFVKR